MRECSTCGVFIDADAPGYGGCRCVTTYDLPTHHAVCHNDAVKKERERRAGLKKDE